MGHLKNSEIFEYLKTICASVTKNSEEVKKVNGHVLACPECAAKLRRAILIKDSVKAMSAENFSLYDIAYENLDVPAEDIRLAVSELSDVGREHERAIEY
ncbi:MAG: hypothetical protein IJT70_03660 [Clostridia bacterium]|nr:hypothetical protein [Clostridia bacterium]